MRPASRRWAWLLCAALAAPAANAFIRGRAGAGGPFLRRTDFDGIRFLINEQTAPGLLNSSGSVIITNDSDPIVALQAAMEAWTNVASSTAAFVAPGRTPGGAAGLDREHVIAFNDTPEHRSAIGDAIAVTLQRFNGATGDFVDTDIVFNPTLTYSTTLQPGSYDIQSVALHELGHALGSSHSGLLSSTMYARTRSGTNIQGQLSPDDVAFVTDAYPEPGSAGSFGAITGTVSLSSGTGVNGALITAVDSSTGIAVGSLTFGDGSFTISRVPPGRYFVYAEPMDGPVITSDIGSQGAGANTQFLTAVLGGATSPQAVVVTAGNASTASVTVEGGSPPLNIQGAGSGLPGASISLAGGAFPLRSGPAMTVALFGNGLDDPSITESTISFLGAPISIQAGSLRRGRTTSGAPSLSFLVTVAANAPAGVGTLMVSSSTAAAVFSAGARIQPGPPSFSAAGVVSGASFATGAAAPGEIVSIFGTGLGPAIGATGSFDASGRLVNSLADVTVTFNNVRAPLFFARQDQINAQVPFEVAGQASASVVVTYQLVSSPVINVPLAAARPGIFVWPDGSNRGIILNQDNNLNDANNRAPRGSVVTVFATGQGAIDPPLATGAPAPASPLSQARNVTATIGGQPARVQFAGMAPGFVGLFQVNVEVPAAAPTGAAVPIVITVGNVGSRSNVTIAVRE